MDESIKGVKLEITITRKGNEVNIEIKDYT